MNRKRKTENKERENDLRKNGRIKPKERIKFGGKITGKGENKRERKRRNSTKEMVK